MNIQKEIMNGKINILKKYILKGVQDISNINNKKLLKEIKKLHTLEELLAVEWSLDYLIPLIYRNNYKWYFIIYEKLLMNKTNYISSILNKINEPIQRDISKAIDTPTHTSIENKIIIKKQITKWKTKLTQSQIDKILSVVSLFGINFYSDKTRINNNSFKNWQYYH